MMNAVIAHKDQELECRLYVPKERKRREQLFSRHSTYGRQCLRHSGLIPSTYLRKTRWLDVGSRSFEIERKVSDAIQEPDISKRDMPSEIPCRTRLGIGFELVPESGIAAITLEVVRISRPRRSSVRSRVALANSGV